MNEQVKQKVLVGVLAALVLGMGSIWFFGRDSSSDINFSSSSSGQKIRRVHQDDTERSTRRSIERTKKTTAARRERTVKTVENKSKKKPRRKPDLKTKKKKIVPAA